MPASRLSRCLAFALVALAALLAAPVAAADKPCAEPKADAKPLEIKAIGPDPAIFSAASAEARFALPLTLPPGLARADLTAQLVEVRRDKLVDAGVQGRFKVQKSLGGAADAPAAVQFEVHKIDTLLPATYQVLLAFHHRCGTALSPLMLILERPAAQITPPGRIHVDVWLPFGFGAAKGNAVPAQIQLQPVDGFQLSALRSVEFRDDRYRAANGDPLPITLGAAAASVPAGRPLAVTLAPAGVPTGVNQGKVQVLSPDLKAPLWIEVELRGRLYRAWIPLLVAFGIGAGFLLRVVLQAWLDRLQAGSEGLAALGELQARVRDIDDAVFKRRTQEPLSALREALLKRDPTTIKSRQKAALQAVEEAMLRLQQTLTAAEAHLSHLRSLAAGTGALPSDMQAAVDAIGAPCDEAADRLNAKDATGAQERLDAIHAKLRSELERCAPLTHGALAAHDREISALRAWLDPQQHALRALDAAEPRFADTSYAAAAESLRNLDAGK
jgi:hypothetical protein